MRLRSASHLLRLPVRVHGIQLGWPVDVILDLQGKRVLGLDVLCGDEVHRFLPLAAANIDAEEIGVGSPLTLLEDNELAFYREHASTLSALDGAAVEQDGVAEGSFEDVILDEDGVIDEVVVEGAAGRRRLAFANGVVVRVTSAPSSRKR
jgi:uncharacterized protein YrrD